nr:hypothetical protein [Tanacetum cinerariifolium]
NKERDAAFDGKEHDAEKPESTVNLSPSNSARSGEQDDMTKKKDKGKKMLEMEDIAYSDHVGAEADFNNLETSITVSPILTTKTNKDHPVA